MSETLDDLKSMSLDESTSCHWSIYNGDGRLSDADVDGGCCTVGEVSTIANTEETDLSFYWRSECDDVDLEVVLIFADYNYENECPCDVMATSMVDKSLQVTRHSMAHDDMHSDEGCCKCGCGLSRIFRLRRLRRLCRLLRRHLHPRRMSRRRMP